METCYLLPSSHTFNLNRFSHFYRFNLIGHLIQADGTKPLNPAKLCDILESVWKPALPWRLLPMGKNYYTLQFSSPHDQLYAASLPTWFVPDYGLINVESWSPEFDPYKSRVTFVRWNPPAPSWVKINTDGAVRGRPRKSACGGVFRDSTGSVLRCFSKKLECRRAFDAELDGAITALEIAEGEGWNQIWFEADCSEVVTLLCSRSRSFLVGSDLQDRWLRVLDYLDQITFEATHIYREGNAVADALANPDAEGGCWDCATTAIAALVQNDAAGYLYSRIRK